MEKHLEAMGGKEALEKLRTRKITGRVSVSNLSGEFSGTIETYAKAPNKPRSFMKLVLSATGMDHLVLVQRFNGTSGFGSNSLQGDSEIKGMLGVHVSSPRFYRFCYRWFRRASSLG